MYGGGIQLGTEHGQGQNITHLFEPGTPVLVPEFCGASGIMVKFCRTGSNLEKYCVPPVRDR